MSVTFQSVPQLLQYRVQQSGDKIAYSYPSGQDWKRVSWATFGDQTRQVSMGLRALGLQNEQRVAIVSNTRYDWVLADMGILCAGGATTTI